LARRKQAAKHFAHFAAGGQGRKKQLHFFHARRNHCLQIDGGKHRDSGYLRGRGSFGNCLLEASTQQLPLGWLAWSRNNRNNAKLLPQFRNRAQYRAFGYFPAHRLCEFGDGCIAEFQLLVGLDRQL
jgi:hypothetical protein